MRTNFVLAGAVLLLIAGCARAPAPASPKATATTAIPAVVSSDKTRPDCTGDCKVPVDVLAFIDSRNDCDHWRGEPLPEKGDDPEGVRKKQILDGIRSACTGMDKRLSALKATYADDPHVMQLLDEYDSDIESDG